MAGKESILHTLEELLGIRHEVLTSFDALWVSRAGCTPNSLKNLYQFLHEEVGLSNQQILNNLTLLLLSEKNIMRSFTFLKKAGLTSKQIIASPQLLALNLRRLRGNFRALSKLGLAAKIRQHSVLLYRNSHTLETNFEYLKAIGLTKRKIVATPLLLISDPQTVKRHWDNLNRRGLSNEKIIVNPHLLQLSSETVDSNYQNLRRYFEKEQIAIYPSLLGLPGATVDANIAFLNWIGVDYSRMPMLTLTSPQRKREKMGWLIRLVSNSKSSETSLDPAITIVRNLVARKPKLLIYSLASLENRKSTLLRNLGL